MGNSVVDNRNGHKQPESNRDDISTLSGHMDYLFGKGDNKMVEIKGIVSVLNFLGFSLYGYVTLINIENVKGWILVIIGSLFGVAKLYFYVKRQLLAINKEKQEQRKFDLEYDNMLRDKQEKDIMNMEKELDLQIKLLGKRDRK